MLDPVGLAPFAERWPDRVFDVGIAEQHAVTSAAGLAMGGMRPIVAVYATFMNRAFDQVLMDVALHKLPVVFVMDRAGVTGEDGASHNGMWDLSWLPVVPGLDVAAPRDEERLQEALDAGAGAHDGPTAIRFPKGLLPDALPARSPGGKPRRHARAGRRGDRAAGRLRRDGADGARGRAAGGRPGHRAARRRSALRHAGRRRADRDWRAGPVS